MEGGAGVNIYNFLHGKDSPLDKPGDKVGPTKIIKPSTDTQTSKVVGQGDVAASQPSSGSAGPSADHSTNPSSDFAPSALKKVDQAERNALGYKAGGVVKRPGMYAANGGPVDGPGTGTSDSVPINASNGEYVIPAEIVKFLGTGFFDKLIKETTTAMGSGAQAPGPWDEMAQNDMGVMEPGGSPSRPPRSA